MYIPHIHSCIPECSDPSSAFQRQEHDEPDASNAVMWLRVLGALRDGMVRQASCAGAEFGRGVGFSSRSRAVARLSDGLAMLGDGLKEKML